MDDNATPTRRTRPRPTRYPAGLSIMTTDAQRAAIDAIADREDRTVGDVVRGLIDDGLAFRDYREGRRRTLNG